MKSIIIFVLFFYGCIQIHEYQCGVSEKKLLKTLFDPNAHDKMERPVKNESEIIQVQMELSLVKILELNQRTSHLLVTMWMFFGWNDYHFQWNPKDYNGVDYIRVPSDKIWLPDIRMYNSIDDNLVNEVPILTVIGNRGDVIWVPPGQYKASCPIDVTLFPFDVQRCQLKFGSWTFSANILNLSMKCAEKNCIDSKGLKLDDYAEDEYQLLNHRVKRVDMIYPSSPEVYTHYTFDLLLRRHPRHYVLHYLTPCFILSLMVLLVFLLPPSSGEKITLGIVLLALLTAFLLLIAQKVPESSTSSPLISRYILSIMVLCALSIFCSVLILNLHHGSGNQIPNWIKFGINKGLARLLLMKRDDNGKEKEEFPLQAHETPTSSNSKDNLAIILEELTKISRKVASDNSQRVLAKEWIFAARVIDRLCLVLFGVVTIICACTFLLVKVR